MGRLIQNLPRTIQLAGLSCLSGEWRERGDVGLNLPPVQVGLLHWSQWNGARDCCAQCSSLQINGV